MTHQIQRAIGKRVFLNGCWLTVCLAFLSLIGCGDKPDDNENVSKPKTNSQPVIHFVDRTKESNIDTVYNNGRSADKFTMLETLGGGAAIFDFDLDDIQDVLLTTGGNFIDVEGTDSFRIQGLPIALWQGIGNAKFQPAEFNAEYEDDLIYSQSVQVADFDDDGFPDVLITGYAGVRLYRNMGDGSFTHVSDTKLPTEAWSSCAAWGDWNGDGILDIYVVNYLSWSPEIHRACPAAKAVGLIDVCAPRHFDDQSDRVFLGRGDGTFEDRTEAMGLVAGGKGLGVISVDIDRDGDLDIYVANDTTPNFLYMNDGEGRFEEFGLNGGVALDGNAMPNGSMGVTIGDYDLDGMFDLGVANFDHESYAIYRQDQPGVFFFMSDATGITAIGKNRVSWGTAFVDFDADGDEDLIINNGHILYYPATGNVAQPCVLMENQAGRFNEIELDKGHYLNSPHDGRGLSVGDLDNDLDLDVVFSNMNEPVGVLCNESDAKGDLFRLDLLGIESPRQGLGAVVEIKTDKSKQLRTIAGSGSFLSTNQPSIFFAIPNGERLESLSIFWPSGKETRIAMLDPGAWLVREDGKIYAK